MLRVGIIGIGNMGWGMAQRLSRTLDVIEQSSGQSWIGSDRMRRALLMRA